MIEVGSWIQWKSQGVFQFEIPKKVVGVSDHPDLGCYVFVEGTPTGISIEEVEEVPPPDFVYGDFSKGFWFCPSCKRKWDPRHLWECEIKMPAVCRHCDIEIKYGE